MPLDDKVQAALDMIFTADSELYANRGWNVRSGFGKRPALLYIDRAKAWTRPGYKFFCDDMDESIIPGVQRLLKASNFNAKRHTDLRRIYASYTKAMLSRLTNDT